MDRSCGRQLHQTLYWPFETRRKKAAGGWVGFARYAQAGWGMAPRVGTNQCAIIVLSNASQELPSGFAVVGQPLWAPCWRTRCETGATTRGRPYASPEQRLDLGTQRRGDVVALKRVSDIGGEKTDLAAAIEAAAFEFEPVERLLAGEPDHRIGDLDFAAGAAGLVGQNVEDLRLENVAARDDEI